MENMPLVSVALCVYNGEKYLSAQIESILGQTYENIEIIIVDDCSTDNSPNIIEKYAREYPQIRVYTNAVNLGYVKNFEKAMRLCTGQYIALSDQDDIWHPDKISTQVTNLGDNLLIYHDSEFIDEEGQDLHKKMSDILNMYEGNSSLPFILTNCVSGHTILFNRLLLEYALPLPAAFFHDWWLAFVASARGAVKALPVALVKYRQHTQSTIDILARKEGSSEQNSVTEDLLVKKDWIGLCSALPHGHSAYLAAIYRLIKPYPSLLDKIRLYLLLSKNRKLLHFISKSPEKRQLKMIRRQVFKW